MNKRKYSRVLFETKAVISFSDINIEGEVENLSMKGAFIKTKTPVNLVPNDKINLRLELTGSTSKLNLELKAVVKRIDEEGFGIEFTSMDLDSFTHLKNIIAYNSGEYEKVLEEFENSSKKY
jgi:hypothetical protein